jgi:hypothetical protein
METLAAVPGVRTVRIPKGKLSVHEEFPDATMQAYSRREPFANSAMAPSRVATSL